MQTMKRLYDEHKNRIDPTHRAEDRNNCRNSLLFDFHKTIDPTEGTPQGEDSQEDSLEVEASRVEEDTQEAEGTQEAEEYHLEDHREVTGGHCHYQYRKYIKENW